MMTEESVNNTSSNFQPCIVWVDGEPIKAKYGDTYTTKTITSYRGPNLGKFVTHPCDMSHSQYIHSGMSYFTQGPFAWSPYPAVFVSGRCLAAFGIFNRYSGRIPLWPDFYSGNTAYALSGVIEKVWASATQPFVPAVHITGEIMETINALKSPMAGIRTVLETARSRLKKKAPWSDDPFSKQIAGAYLEHVFGTMPNVSMAGTLAEAAAESIEKIATDNVKRHAAGKYFPISEETADFSFYVPTHRIPGINLNWDVGAGGYYYKATRKTGFYASAGMYVRHLGNFSTKPNIASIAAEGWELLPLSFVANWFVNVSQLLKECRPIPGKVLGSWSSIKMVQQTVYELKSVTGIYGAPVSGYSGDSTFTVKKILYHRDIDISRTGTLHLGAGLNSIGKGVSLLALARQFK